MKLLSFTTRQGVKVAIVVDKIVAVRKTIGAETGGDEDGTMITTLDGRSHMVTDSIKSVLDALLAQQSRPPPANDEGS